MSFSNLSGSGRRVAATLLFALAVAGLMLAAARMKQSAPAGSVAKDLWNGVILALAVVGLFIPLLALRLPGGNNIHSGSSK